MSPSATDAREDASPSSPPPPERLTKVPLWIPISAFVGTSLALALPLFLLRRRGTSRFSLNTGTAPPPPRRAHAGATVPPPTPASTSAASSGEQGATTLRAEIETPSAGELMSALARVNANSALMAAKAFGIATALVVAGGAGLAWTVRTTMDVHDVREFGQKMRAVMWRTVPGLTSRILRPTQSDEHTPNTPLHTLHTPPHTSPADSAAAEAWSWEDSQRRLQRAYEDGGFALWAQVALREMELEAGAERGKREREFREEEGGRTRT